MPAVNFFLSPCSFKTDTDVRETKQKRDLGYPQISSFPSVQGCTLGNRFFSKGIVFPLPIAVPKYYRPSFYLFLTYGRNLFCGKKMLFFICSLDYNSIHHLYQMLELLSIIILIFSLYLLYQKLYSLFHPSY